MFELKKLKIKLVLKRKIENKNKKKTLRRWEDICGYNIYLGQLYNIQNLDWSTKQLNIYLNYYLVHRHKSAEKRTYVNLIVNLIV